MKLYERVWLNKVDQIIEQNMSNSTFSASDISPILGISQTTLYRNLVKLTGFSPSKYLLHTRLLKAKEILDNGEYATIEKIALATGFNNGTYFSRQFSQKYKVAPQSRLKTKKLIKGDNDELLKTTAPVQIPVKGVNKKIIHA